MSEDAIAYVTWHRSSFSGAGGTGSGNCVEATRLPDGRAALRDSKSPESGMVSFGGSGMSAWLSAVKAGEYDGRI